MNGFYCIFRKKGRFLGTVFFKVNIFTLVLIGGPCQLTLLLTLNFNNIVRKAVFFVILKLDSALNYRCC